jgi:uncharacterized protein YsxB (DUF464 family)
MITALFFCRENRLTGFDISGHSDYAEAGYDVVCASVSSAAQLVCNTITDYFRDPADVRVGDNIISFRLCEGCSEYSYELLSSFEKHLEFISEDYAEDIDLIHETEVT